MPPHSSGNGRPNKPISAMPATTSYGNECSASCRADTGATTLWAKSRTVLANCWYSSGSVPVDKKSLMSAVLCLWCCVIVRGNPGQRLTHLDLVAHGDEEFDHALDRCGHRVLHLHRLDRDDNRTRLDLSAVVDADRNNRARHGAGQFGVAAVLFVLAHGRFAHLLEHGEDAVAGQPDLAVRRRDRVLDA